MNTRAADPSTTPAFIRLGDIAHARSGDKGNHANVGVIAYSLAGYEFLGRILTETRMAEYLLPLRPRQVQRFVLPGIRAYNFLLHDILAGGASRSLRTDNQGKVLAVAVLEMPIPAPVNLQEMIRQTGDAELSS
jgi:hypothetical protein